MSITWQKCEKAEGVSEKYCRDKAVEMASMMDTAVDSVLDLYAGKMLLKEFLADRIQYCPIDYTSRCDRTIVCDFNQRQFPKIKADAVFISGCLEYVEDAEWFLKQIVRCCKKEIILSYHPIEKTPDITIRKNRLWVNHYSTKELVQIIQKQGFLLTALRDFHSDDNTNEVLYKFKRAEPALLPEYLFCTGCGACSNACPADAITMKPDRDGYLRPAVSSDECIACGKCLQICPSLHPQYKNTKKPECYAVWADDSIREKSSSGGAFTLLANEIFQRDGYVCGAAWTEDFGVNHIIIHNPNELTRLRHSKYVQSDTCACYSKIKELLQRNKIVLFSGCPCQVAGLYAFLGKEYDNLYTIDLLCAQAPSQKIFKKYLRENYNVLGLTNLEFRSKLNGWNPDTLLAEEKDGCKIIKNSTNDFYEKGYHPRLFMSVACEQCQFADTPRQGDLTIGDYWWCKSSDRELDDNKGTSTVLVNNPKGMELFEKIKPNFKLCQSVPLDNNRKTNRISMHFAAHAGRDRFYELIQKMPLNKAVDYALNGKYDIGIVGDWSVENFGANLTYYALYHVIRDLGYELLMIERPGNSPWKPNRVPACFQTNPYRPYDLAPIYPSKQEMRQLSDKCGTFLVGSDQLFNDNLNRCFGEFITLDWVKNSQKKIAYGASFGSDFFGGTDETRAKMSFFMKQFDAFSVRENSGVDMAEKEFGVPAIWVLDPVFLCDRKYYDELAQKADKHQKRKYIGVYMLDPNKAKASAVRFAINQLHLPCHATSDAAYSPDKIKQDWDIETDQHVFCEDLLRNIMDCDFWITDSFHGVCFAIIYQKPFIAIANEGRGLTRFTSILELLGLSDRLVYDPAEIEKRPDLFSKIDYEPVCEKLSCAKEKSLLWLKTALKAEKRIEYSAYDILDEHLDAMEARLNGIDDYAKGVNKRFEDIDEYAKGANKRFEDIDNYVRRTDRRLEMMENQLAICGENMANMKAYIDYVNSRTIRFQLKKHLPKLWRLLKELKK